MTQSYQAFTDIVSDGFSKVGSCGAVTYTLQDANGNPISSNLVSIAADEQTYELTVDASSYDQASFSTFKLEARLAEYPDVAPLTSVFTVEVLLPLTELPEGIPDDLASFIEESAAAVSATETVTVEPSLDVTYSMSYEETMTLPFFFIVEDEAGEIPVSLSVDLNAHPFISAQTNEQDVLFMINGPEALNFFGGENSS